MQSPFSSIACVAFVADTESRYWECCWLRRSVCTKNDWCAALSEACSIRDNMIAVMTSLSLMFTASVVVASVLVPTCTRVIPRHKW